jgi:Domain of unknown function (DUF3067)
MPSSLRHGVSHASPKERLRQRLTVAINGWADAIRPYRLRLHSLTEICSQLSTLNSQLRTPMTGRDLRELITTKWDYSYDVQIKKTPSKIFVQIMWKYLEQASFPLSEADYLAHLDTVAGYLVAMGGVGQVQKFIETTTERPRLGKAVSIPLNLGDRTSEWIV